MISYTEHGYDAVIKALHSFMNVTQQSLCIVLGIACRSTIPQFPSNVKHNGKKRPTVQQPPTIIAGIRPYKTHFQPASTYNTIFYTTQDGISTTASADPSLTLGIYDSVDTDTALQHDSNEAWSVQKGPKVVQHWSTGALIFIILGVFYSFFRLNRDVAKSSRVAPREKARKNSLNKPLSRFDTVIAGSDLLIKELDIVNIDSGFINLNLQGEKDTELVTESTSQYLFPPPGYQPAPATSNVKASTFTKATLSLPPVRQTQAATKSRPSDFDDLYDVSDDDLEYSASKNCPDISPRKEPTYKTALVQTEQILETPTRISKQANHSNLATPSASGVEKKRIEFLETELKTVEAKCEEKHKQKEKEWERKCKRLQEQRDTAKDNGRLEKTLDVISNMSNRGSSKESGIKIKALQKVEDLQAKLGAVEEELQLALSSNKVMVNELRATDERLKISEANLKKAETARRNAQAAHDNLASIHVRCQSTPKVSTRQRRAAETKPASPRSDRPTQLEQDEIILAPIVVPIASPVAATRAPTLTSPTLLHNLFQRSRSLQRIDQRPTVEAEATPAEEGASPAAAASEADDSKPQISAQPLRSAPEASAPEPRYGERVEKLEEETAETQQKTVDSGLDTAQGVTSCPEKVTEESTKPVKAVSFENFRFDVSGFQFPSRDEPPALSPSKFTLTFNPFVPSMSPRPAQTTSDEAETAPKHIQSISHTGQESAQPPATLTPMAATDGDEQMDDAPPPERPAPEPVMGMNESQSNVNAQAPIGIPEPMDYDVPPPQVPAAPTGIPEPMDYDVPPPQNPTAPTNVPEPMDYDAPPTQGPTAPTDIPGPMDYEVPPPQDQKAPISIPKSVNYEVPPLHGPEAPTNVGSTYDFGDPYPEFDPDGPESAPASPDKEDEYDIHNPLIDFDDGFDHESPLSVPKNDENSIEDPCLHGNYSPHDRREQRSDDDGLPESSQAAEKAVPKWVGRSTCSDAELLGEEDEDDDGGPQDRASGAQSSTLGPGNCQATGTPPFLSSNPVAGDVGKSGVSKSGDDSSPDLSDHVSTEFEDVIKSTQPASENHPNTQSTQHSERKGDDTDLAATLEDEEDEILKEMRRLEEFNPELFLPTYDAIPSVPVEPGAGLDLTTQDSTTTPYPEHQTGGNSGGVSAPVANDSHTPSTSSIAVGGQSAETGAPSVKDNDDEFTISTPEQIKARKLKPLRGGAAKRAGNMTTKTVSNPSSSAVQSAGGVHLTTPAISIPPTPSVRLTQVQAKTTTESSAGQADAANAAGNTTVAMAPPVGHTLTREELEEPPQFDDRWRQLPGNLKIPRPLHTPDPSA